MLIKHAGLDDAVPAQQWLRHSGTKKDLNLDWVFAGSTFVTSSRREPFYAANEGDLICVSNFDSALLDLPIPSSQESGYLQYEAKSDHIPPLDSPVHIILEPILGER